MTWTLHVIGASLSALLAWFAFCAMAPSRVPGAPWREDVAAASAEAAYTSAPIDTEAILQGELARCEAEKTQLRLRQDAAIERLER
jgi:hypothetical protein